MCSLLIKTLNISTRNIDVSSTATTTRERTSGEGGRFKSRTVGRYVTHVEHLLSVANSVGVYPKHVSDTVSLLSRIDELAKVAEDVLPILVPYLDYLVKYLLSRFHDYTLQYVNSAPQPALYEQVLQNVRTRIAIIHAKISKSVKSGKEGKK